MNPHESETIYSKLPMPGESLQISSVELVSADVLGLLDPILTDERKFKIDEVVSSRTDSFVPVLENIYDRGNTNAVMRSAEAFGFYKFYTVSPEGAKQKDSNRITKGTHKWLDIHPHYSPESAIKKLKSEGYQILCTHLRASKSIFEYDFVSQPTALIFGNESDGVSPEMAELADGNCIIPIDGFAESFNISVAAAISFYHVYLQRVQKLGKNGSLSLNQQNWLKANYYIRSFGGLEKFAKLVANKYKL